MAIEEPCIICSIDHDLQQIPGLHYNLDKKTITEVTPSEGTYRFYYQLLVGDSGDNITPSVGLSAIGIGKAKAERLLEGCETEEEMAQACYEAYIKAWKGLPIEEVNKKFLLTGKLVKIRTKQNEIWSSPIELNGGNKKEEGRI